MIGLLGGTFCEEEKVLKVGRGAASAEPREQSETMWSPTSLCVCVQICAAEPCNSVSTGLQCEMDPVSQTQACDVLSALGLGVVGWYHSHPSFHPNPSVRDINTQDQFQVRSAGLEQGCRLQQSVCSWGEG